MGMDDETRARFFATLKASDKLVESNPKAVRDTAGYQPMPRLEITWWQWVLLVFALLYCLAQFMPERPNADGLYCEFKSGPLGVDEYCYDESGKLVEIND